jgi:hypothetical protein
LQAHGRVPIRAVPAASSIETIIEMQATPLDNMGNVAWLRQTNSVWSNIETLVTSTDGARWLELLYRLQLRCSLEPSEKAMADELIALGLCKRDQDDVHLTAFGTRCADSAREYLFWIQRDRQPLVRRENFRDKDIHWGGMGLQSCSTQIRTVARRVVGVEVEPVYIKMSRILANTKSH